MAEPLIAGLLCLFICLTSGDYITLNKNAVRNADLQIFIDTGTITNQVVLKKPDGSVEGKCLAPLNGDPGLCFENVAQNGTITTVTLSSVSRVNNQGLWTSIHGSNKGNINITVLTIPTLNVSQTVSALTLPSSNTQSLTITATCAYPAVSLDVYFVPTGGGTAVSSPLSTATCTNTGNAGCTDTDANIYNCVIVPKVETSLSAGTYHVQFVVNLIGQYEPIGLNSTITDTVITTKGPPETPTDFRDTDVSQSSITVKWTKGFNGGHSQIFVILYGPEAEGFINTVSMDENLQSKYKKEITGLKPNTRYRLNMYAYNEEGNSSLSVESDIIGKTDEANSSICDLCPTTTNSSICDLCPTTIALAVIGLVVAVVCVAFSWKVYFHLSEFGVTRCFRSTIIATVVSVSGLILCIAGLIICVTCDNSSNSVTVGFALAVSGFVFPDLTLVIVIILMILACCGKNRNKIMGCVSELLKSQKNRLVECDPIKLVTECRYKPVIQN